LNWLGRVGHGVVRIGCKRDDRERERGMSRVVDGYARMGWGDWDGMVEND
jgi:hypothetical protein